MLPATLTCLQSLLLPVLARVFASALCASDRAQAFAFAYGILPCANAFLVVAQAYDVAPPMQAMVASYLALGKIVAYPVRAPTLCTLSAPEAVLTTVAPQDENSAPSRHSTLVIPPIPDPLCRVA